MKKQGTVNGVIMARRKELGKSQSEVARALGISHQAYSNMERGGGMDMKYLESLASVLDLRVLFVSGDDYRVIVSSLVGGKALLFPAREGDTGVKEEEVQVPVAKIKEKKVKQQALIAKKVVVFKEEAVTTEPKIQAEVAVSNKDADIVQVPVAKKGGWRDKAPKVVPEEPVVSRDDPNWSGWTPVKGGSSE